MRMMVVVMRLLGGGRKLSSFNLFYKTKIKQERWTDFHLLGFSQPAE